MYFWKNLHFCYIAYKINLCQSLLFTKTLVSVTLFTKTLVSVKKACVITFTQKKLVPVTLFTKKNLCQSPCLPKKLMSVTLFRKKTLCRLLCLQKTLSVTLFTKKLCQSLCLTCISHFVYQNKLCQSPYLQKKLVSVTLFPVLYPLYCMCVSKLSWHHYQPRLHNVYWVTIHSDFRTLILFTYNTNVDI